MSAGNSHSLGETPEKGKIIVEYLCGLAGRSLTEVLDQTGDRTSAKRALENSFSEWLPKQENVQKSGVDWKVPRFRVIDQDERIYNLSDLEAAIVYLERLPGKEKAQPGLSSLIYDELLGWVRHLRNKADVYTPPLPDGSSPDLDELEDEDEPEIEVSVDCGAGACLGDSKQIFETLRQFTAKAWASARPHKYWKKNEDGGYVLDNLCLKFSEGVEIGLPELETALHTLDSYPIPRDCENHADYVWIPLLRRNIQTAINKLQNEIAETDIPASKPPRGRERKGLGFDHRVKHTERYNPFASGNVIKESDVLAQQEIKAQQDGADPLPTVPLKIERDEQDKTKKEKRREGIRSDSEIPLLDENLRHDKITGEPTLMRRLGPGHDETMTEEEAWHPEDDYVYSGERLSVEQDGDERPRAGTERRGLGLAGIVAEFNKGKRECRMCGHVITAEEERIFWVPIRQPAENRLLQPQLSQVVCEKCNQEPTITLTNPLAPKEKQDPPWHASLSAQQKEVIDLKAQGLKQKEIASRLDLSEPKVSRLLKQAKAKEEEHYRERAAR